MKTRPTIDLDNLTILFFNLLVRMMMNGTPGNIFAVGAMLWASARSHCPDVKEAGSLPPAPPMPSAGDRGLFQTVPTNRNSSDKPRPREYRRDSPPLTSIIKHRFRTSEGRDIKQGDRLYESIPFRFRAAYVSAKVGLALK